MKNKSSKKIIILVVLAILFVTGTVALILLDVRKARLKEYEKIQQRYLEQLLDIQARESEKVSLDEAREDLPDVDKVDFEP